MAKKLKTYTMKKEIVCLFFLIISLWSCAAIEKPNFYPSLESRKRQIVSWAAAEKVKVDAGTLRNSVYWTQFYQKSIELRPDLDDFLYFANEMIKVSRIFEEGEITREQFESKYRQLTALLEKEESRRSKILLQSTMGSYQNFELALFTSYRGSLFVDYVNDLGRQLNAEGPQYSSSHCAFFGNIIRCTAQNPLF